jgi:hypothetical protein
LTGTAPIRRLVVATAPQSQELIAEIDAALQVRPARPLLMGRPPSPKWLSIGRVSGSIDEKSFFRQGLDQQTLRTVCARSSACTQEGPAGCVGRVGRMGPVTPLASRFLSLCRSILNLKRCRTDFQKCRLKAAETPSGAERREEDSSLQCAGPIARSSDRGPSICRGLGSHIFGSPLLPLPAKAAFSCSQAPVSNSAGPGWDPKVYIDVCRFRFSRFPSVSVGFCWSRRGG